jgi:inner membrane protein
MDNLTHSVVGLGIGALIDRGLAPEANSLAARTRQRMLLTIGCLASNFPDLDLVLTPLLGKPLGYLLHHRGHTHTLLAAAGEAALLLALVWLLWPAARHVLRASAAARTGAVAAAVAGLLLHLGMDSLNVYGTHPFWPFDDRWIYGDLVFIVEPVFWIAFGVPLAALVPNKGLRRAFLVFLFAAPVLFTLAGFLQAGSLALLLALGGLLAWIERARWAQASGGTERAGSDRHRDRTALATGLSLSLAFVGVQAIALHEARAIVGADLARRDPGERLLDIALSAYPANPLCWSVATVATGASGDAYRVRRGLLSIAPGISPVTACPAPIAGQASGGEPQLAWNDDSRLSLDDLRRADRTDCHVHAWMRFARVPALIDGSATDLRWSPAGTRNFTTLDVAEAANTPCPQPVPGWGVPRGDLLNGQ